MEEDIINNWQEAFRENSFSEISVPYVYNLLLSGVHVSKTAASLVSHSVVCSAPRMQVSESGRRVL